MARIMTAHDPANTTVHELIDHVKSHLTPELALDHLSDYDVRCLIGLTCHSLTYFGLSLVPSATVSDDLVAEVGRIEPSIAGAAELLAGACWRSVLRRLGDLAEWFDARLEERA